MANFGKYFCGNMISEYGRKNGRVDYATFCKAFDAVLNNSIMAELERNGYYFELESGLVDNSDEIAELEERIAEIEDDETITDEERETRTAELEDEIEELRNEEDGDEIFQYYIVDNAGADLIRDYNVGYLFYCDKLDMYIWGITHYGTSWDYVLTDIICDIDSDARA